MGLFHRRMNPQEALDRADRVAQGKGLAGGLTRMVMGREFMGEMQGAVAAAQQAQAAGAAMQAGAPAQVATVTAIQDTGQTINDDPNVVLTLDLGGVPLQLTTLVSRLQIPRPGDRVYVLSHPQSGLPLYGGPAL